MDGAVTLRVSSVADTVIASVCDKVNMTEAEVATKRPEQYESTICVE
jgi:hypothetical protein